MTPRSTLPALLVLAGLLSYTPTLAQGITYSQDFNSVRLPRIADQVHPYPNWTVEVDGRVWYDVSFVSQGPDSSVCLVLRASTVDPGMTDAAVRLRLDLRSSDPEQYFLMPEDGVLQWDWWFRDNRLSEAVGVRLIYSRGDRRETREHWNTPFYTPSDGFDPVLVWDCHRLDLADLFTPCEDPDQECIELEALEFELRGPVSQELRLDNIYLGPREGVMDCRVARTPGFVVQKLQSYSASMADLNHDGHWDVLLPGFLGRSAQCWMGASPQMVDATPSLGLDRYLGDVCLFLDIDNDGDQDLALARVEREGMETLENIGYGRFASEPRHHPTRTMPLNVTAMAAGDANGDGALDIYLTVHDEVDLLMLGDGRGGFHEASPDLALSLRERRVSTGVAWSDFDSDGDADLVIAGAGLLRNEGVDGFQVTGPAPTRGSRPMVEGITVADLDGDGIFDIYLGVDQDSCRRPFSGRNLLFWGDADGGLRRDARSRTAVADPGHCEGVAAADFNNDGHLDLFIGNRSGPSLCLLGTGGGHFKPDRGEVFGNLEITDLYGLVAADKDDDGDLDIFVLRKHNDPLYLLNRTTTDNFIKARLMGVKSNWDAVGARAVLTRSPDQAGAEPDSFLALRELQAGDGFQLSGPRELHFGVPGPGTYRLAVTFPSGKTIVKDGLKPGDRTIVVESSFFLEQLWHRWFRAIQPRWSARSAMWPLPFQHGIMVVLAALTFLAWLPLLRRLRMGIRRPRLPILGMLLLVMLAMGVHHQLGWHRLDAWGLAISLPMGLAIGASVPVGLRYLRRQRAPLAVWDRLNEEFISYTHTGWCKNLESLIRQGGLLAGDLDPAEREALQERWQAAYDQYYEAVQAKLSTIAQLGSLLEDTRAASRDLDTGLRRMKRVRREPPVEIAAGARELRLTADRLAAVVESRLSCRVEVAVRTAWRAMLQEFEKSGVQGRLDSEGLSGLRVRIRDHELVMVLQDLLRNAGESAAEHTDTPEVQLIARADLRRVTLVILDNGSGMRGHDPDELTQAGFTTKTQGSGYGLFQARKTLGIYRATLALEDRPEGGLKVTISLMRPLHVRGDLGRDTE